MENPNSASQLGSDGSKPPQSQPSPSPSQIYPDPKPLISAEPVPSAVTEVKTRGLFRRRKLLVFLLVIILVVIGLGIYEKSLSGLKIKTLTNGNYGYTFEYYKGAKPVSFSNGENAYKYSGNTNSAVGGVQPTTSPAITTCSQVGSKWFQAFTVELYGRNYPVCTSSLSVDQPFATTFSALGSNHLFEVVYSKGVTSSIYPKLETIFGSVKVSQQ